MPVPFPDLAGPTRMAAALIRQSADPVQFPAGCVETCASREAALAMADPANKRHAARVVGPSKSSEGQFLYYLLDWL